MRAAAVISLVLILPVAATAQTRSGSGSHGSSGGGYERGFEPIPGFGGEGVEVPTLPPDEIAPEPPAITPEPDVPSVSRPSAGGGGNPPVHAHAGHPHLHCHDEWVCGAYHYEATDNYPPGSNVDQILVGGQWVPGPCEKQSYCP